MKEGIEKVNRDISQPYRVWYRNQIVRFCKTPEEARHYYRLARERKF